MDDLRRVSRTIWVGIGLIIVLLCVAYVMSKIEPRRGRAGTAKGANQAAGSAQASGRNLPVIGPVADFTLTNQDGAVVTLANLRGRVWIADIIFTRCAGPCPILTKEMQELQDALPANSQARLVTLTTDPDYDTPPVLRAYPQRLGLKVDTNRWTFLTGTKKEIAALASGSLKLSAVPVKPEDRQNEADLFIHTTIFVIVDKQGRLRGSFETTGEGVKWVEAKQKILAAVQQLEREQ